MRQIHQLTQVIARVVATVMGLKGSGQEQQAVAITNQALNEELELDIETLLEMDHESMIETLKAKEGINDENLEAIADLFYQLGKTLINNPPHKVKTETLFQRSLFIYRHIERTGNVYSIDRNYRIKEIKSLLTGN